MKKAMLGALVCALMFSANAEDIEVVENNIQAGDFSTVYAGLGMGGNFLKDNVGNRFMGSLVIGAGKQFNNNIYIAGEFLGDFAKSVKKEETVNNVFNKASLSGIVPNLNFKVGYVFKKNVLVYGKVGCSWRKTTLQKNDTKESKKKASIVLGAGVERIFCKKFSAALEGDYNFGYNWNYKIEYKDGNVSRTKEDKAKDLGAGWNIRALVKYNIKY